MYLFCCSSLPLFTFCAVLDLTLRAGYVTDHVTLTQEHSKLYHYLSVFEGDHKRKLAMEARRFEMLSPLLKALNKASFEVLHKQVRRAYAVFVWYGQPCLQYQPRLVVD